MPPLDEDDDEEGKAFRILRCFHAAVSMGEAVDPRRRAGGGMGVDPSISSSRRSPLRCSRRVRLSLAFCLRMCRIPRRLVVGPDGGGWVGLLEDETDSRRSDDPWKEDHASTLVGQERHAVVAARARAAVETDGRMILPILKQNNETEGHLAEFASLPATIEWCTCTHAVGRAG